MMHQTSYLAIRTPLSLVTLLLSLSLSLLSGCEADNLTAGGPGTGGTGPIIPITASNIYLIATDNSRSLINEDMLTQTPENSSDMTPIADGDNRASTYQVNQISLSEDTLCHGFQRSMMLGHASNKNASNEQTPISTLTFQSGEAIPIQVRVENTLDTELIEKQTCQAFELATDTTWTLEDKETCTTETLFQYSAKQVHTYNLSLQLHSTDDITGKYTMRYINQVQTGDTFKSCPTTLAFSITQVD